MESYNQLCIEGYVTNTPLIHPTKGAQTMFTLATYVYNKSTKKDERETWRVRSFISPSFTSKLEKGEAVVIVGRIRNRNAGDKHDVFIQADKIYIKEK